MRIWPFKNEGNRSNSFIRMKFMINKLPTRRQFLNYAKFYLLFLLSSCSSDSKKITIGFQNSFVPNSFKDILPNWWIKEDIKFNNINLKSNMQKYKKSDLILISDGWINNIDFDDFKNHNLSLINRLDEKSQKYLIAYDSYKREKLFPIGVIPYVLIIKNNKNLKIDNNTSWDFLLSKDLKGKIILPNSPRILISIARKINTQNSIKKILNQVNIYDDKNAIDWLINTDSVIALMPYSQCHKFLKIDTRLSLVFPNEGVPLLWNFILIKSNSNISETNFNQWIKSLEDINIFESLKNDGWYLPFNKGFIQPENIIQKGKYSRIIKNPSKECWDNSWSYPPLNFDEKKELEKWWNELSSP